MGCKVVNLGDTAAIVCSRGARPMKCKCGERAQFLCDHVLADGATCDRAVCSRHTTKPAPGKDLCQEHAGAPAQGGLFP